MSVHDALVQIELNTLGNVLKKLDAAENAVAELRTEVEANNRPTGNRLRARVEAVQEALTLWDAAKTATSREEAHQAQVRAHRMSA